MAPKLGHKKSRAGCVRCKARKVKCDESIPCTNCAKRQLPCEYRDQSHRNSSRNSTRSVSETGTVPLRDRVPFATGPSSPYADQEDIHHAFTAEERRLLELRLINHFTTIVTYTFPPCHEQKFRDFWNIDAVSVALEHPLLLNAILAISSLHLATETTPRGYIYSRDTNELSVARVLNTTTRSADDGTYAKAHRIYLNLAIRQQREEISHLRKDNADAIFLTSVLLAYQTLNLLRPLPDATIYTPPIQWLSMSKAISTVVETSQLMELVTSESLSSLAVQMAGEPDFRNRLALFNPLNREPFKALLDWTVCPEADLDDEIKNTYEQTLAYVGSCHRSLLENEPPRILIRRLMCLGILVPAQYAKLLAEGRPRALVILAHHFAISQAVDEHWWFQGAANREVLGIKSILPPEWQWAMEWPLSMLNIGKGKWSTAGAT